MGKTSKLLLIAILLECMLVLCVSAQEYAPTISTSLENEKRPPVIPKHDNVKRVLENKPIPITIDIQGARLSDKVILHFRDKGSFDFHTMVMGYNPSTNLFECTIEEQFHSNEVFEYYIEIFPIGMSSIRVPKTKGQFYEIHSHASSTKYIQAILIILLIASPAIIAVIIGRIRRAHIQRTTLYQQKLRKRKRQLDREREKHYKKYLTKLSGSRTRKNSFAEGKQVSRGQKMSTTKEPAVSVSKPDRKPLPLDDDKVSAQELKRELDEILDIQQSKKQRTEEPTWKPVSKVPTKPAGFSDEDKQSGKMPVTAPVQQKPEETKDKTGPIPKALLEKTRPSVSTDKAKTEQDEKVESPTNEITKKVIGKKKTLNKNERNKLLDILGLDDV